MKIHLYSSSLTACGNENFVNSQLRFPEEMCMKLQLLLVFSLPPESPAKCHLAPEDLSFGSSCDCFNVKLANGDTFIVSMFHFRGKKSCVRPYLLFLLGTQKATSWIHLQELWAAMTPGGGREQTRVSKGDEQSLFLAGLRWIPLVLYLALVSTPGQSAQLPTFPLRKFWKAGQLVFSFY